jgi:hypothetical protein
LLRAFAHGLINERPTAHRHAGRFHSFDNPRCVPEKIPNEINTLAERAGDGMSASADIPASENKKSNKNKAVKSLQRQTKFHP